jgi:hypothetical protein
MARRRTSRSMRANALLLANPEEPSHMDVILAEAQRDPRKFINNGLDFYEMGVIGAGDAVQRIAYFFPDLFVAAPQELLAREATFRVVTRSLMTGEELEDFKAHVATEGKNFARLKLDPWGSHTALEWLVRRRHKQALSRVFGGGSRR